MKVLQGLSHENMVNMKEFCKDATWEKESGNKNVAFIVLEIVQGGELFDFIAEGGPLNEGICRFYMRQMLSSLHYLHTHGVTHRDLKPENVLVDQNFNLKIADFGFAAPLAGRHGGGFLKTELGTESYMAPEIHARQNYDGKQIDLFAVGIILFIMYSGVPAFNVAKSSDKWYKYIASNRDDLFWKQIARVHKNTTFSEDFKNLITCMWQPVASQRLTIADIMSHPWMQGEMATQ